MDVTRGWNFPTFLLTSFVVKRILSHFRNSIQIQFNNGGVLECFSLLQPKLSLPAGDRAVLGWLKRYSMFQKFQVARRPFIFHPQKAMEESEVLEILSSRTLNMVASEGRAGARNNKVH